MCKRATASLMLGLLIGVVDPSATLADEAYRINLSPPAHVGDRFSYKVREEERTTTSRSVGGRDPVGIGYSSSVLRLRSIAEVESCDGRGVPNRVKLNVEFLGSPFITAAGEMKTIVEPGSEVIARSALLQADPPQSSDVFSGKDGPVHPEVSAALHRVVTIGGEAESTDQQAFGIDTPIPVGGSWSLDGERGAQLLAKLRIKADPKYVTGKAELVGSVKSGDTDCYDVRMTVRCDPYQPPMKQGQKLQKTSTAAGTVSYRIAKATGRVLEAKYQTHVEVQVAIETVPEIFVDTRRFDVSREMKIADAPAK